MGKTLGCRVIVVHAALVLFRSCDYSWRAVLFGILCQLRPPDILAPSLTSFDSWSCDVSIIQQLTQLTACAAHFNTSALLNGGRCSTYQVKLLCWHKIDFTKCKTRSLSLGGCLCSCLSSSLPSWRLFRARSDTATVRYIPKAAMFGIKIYLIKL